MTDPDNSFQANITQKASEEIKESITSVIRDGMDAFCNNIMNLSNSIIK